MNLEQLKIIIGVLVFFCLVLVIVVCYLRNAVNELTDLLDATFENEQRIADKLDIAHQALKDANKDIQKNNQDHRFNNRVVLINTALKASTPEHLEF